MTVTKETRILLDVCNVLQLRLVCNYRNPDDEKPCDGEVLYQFGGYKVQRDWRCPKCGESWQTTFPANMPVDMREVPPQESASIKLIEAFETLANPGCGPFTVRLETEGDSG